METIQMLGATLGLGFVAGVRLYATVLVLGLGLRLGWWHLPAGFNQHAAILSNPWVLTAAGVAFLAEFFADKVPWVDSLWDSFHTFVRPLGAVILAAGMLSGIDPAIKFLVVLLCGGVALTSHTSKAAVRLAVNHSPEPFSNIALSLLEDVLAPVGVWLSLQHPEVVLVLVGGFMAVFAWLAPKALRLTRLQLVALRAWIFRRSIVAMPGASFQVAGAAPEAGAALSILAGYVTPVPDEYAEAAAKNLGVSGAALGLRCAATKKVGGLRHSIGYLMLCGDELAFITKRWFRYRLYRTKIAEIRSAQLKRGIFLNRLVLETPAGERSFYLFKTCPLEAPAGRERRAHGSVA